MCFLTVDMLDDVLALPLAKAAVRDLRGKYVRNPQARISLMSKKEFHNQ